MILRGGIVVTNNPRREILSHPSIRISNNTIAEILPSGEPESRAGDPNLSSGDEVLDISGYVVIPGFVQTHIHLCQTLFRGLADGLELLDWLRERIFPFEAAHTDASMYASAMIGIAELMRSGTTTILDMGSIHHEEEVIRAVGESGIRAHVGKAMMDINDIVPRLRESTRDALHSTRTLAERWHRSYDGRVRYAPAPRFVLSCSEALMRETAEMVHATEGMILHTHASENRKEIETVRGRFGMDNIEFLDSMSLLSSRACVAHCVHVSRREAEILAATSTSVAHCPSSNLKLGSGIADIPALLARGINVGLGADGASCNNSLSMFQEMRLASLLQKPAHGASAFSAQEVFELATLGGARALGLANAVGSIEPGKKADLVLLDLRRVWNPLEGDIYSSIVYSSGPENVDSVMIDGKWVFRRAEFTGFDPSELVSRGKHELRLLLDRAETA